MNSEHTASSPPNLLFKIINGKKIHPGEGPIASPFTNIRNQVIATTLTISDLLPSLPTELLAKRPMDPATALNIPRESIERALLSGKASLPLHDIYQACPDLFSQSISPTDERRVSLPPDKIVKMLALIKGDATSTPTAASVPAPQQPHSPLPQTAASSNANANDVAGVESKIKNTIFKVDTEAEEPTPAPAPAPAAPIQSPFTINSTPVQKPEPQAPAASPFSIAQPGASSSPVSPPSSGATPPESVQAPATFPASPSKQVVSPFERISALSTASCSPATSAAPNQPSPVATPTNTAGQKITLPLIKVLEFASAEQIGTDPRLLPGSIQVSLPNEIFHRQLANGEKPCVSIAEIRAGLIPEHKVLLAGARPEARIRIPVDSFQTSGTEAPQSKPEQPATSAPSQPLPAHQAQAPAVPVNVNPPAPAPASVSAPTAPSPFLLAPQGTTAPVDEHDPFANMPSLPEWPKASTAPGQAANVHPFSFPPIPGVQEAPSEEHLQSSHFSVPAAAPSVGVTSSFPPAPAAPLAVPPQAPKPITVHPHVGSPTSKPISKHRRMLLRVLLGTHEDVDFDGVIRHICRKPGVSAVACIRNQQIYTSASDGSPEAETFIRQAPILQQHLLPLSNLAGLEGTEIITLRSENRLTSFALNAELTLGILHNVGANETDLLERITLVTTELAAMISDDNAG